MVVNAPGAGCAMVDHMVHCFHRMEHEVLYTILLWSCLPSYHPGASTGQCRTVQDCRGQYRTVEDNAAITTYYPDMVPPPALDTNKTL